MKSNFLGINFLVLILIFSISTSALSDDFLSIDREKLFSTNLEDDNLYLSGFNEYKKVYQSIDSISYYLASAHTESDDTERSQVGSIFKKFSNTLGNNHAGVDISPSVDMDNYLKFRKVSICPKPYFEVNSLDKVIYEDKVNRKCFLLTVIDTNSFINKLTAISDYIHLDKSNLNNEARESFMDQLFYDNDNYKRYKEPFENLLNHFIDKVT